MAAVVQSLQGTERIALETPEGVKLFGVRHFSPAGAWHLRNFLDEHKPALVLIEGPSDASCLIAQAVRDGVKPPIAILCYTAQVPVRSILFPFAEYSPEYQAMKWAEEFGADCRFIDLPSSNKLSLVRVREEQELRFRTELAEENEQSDGAKWGEFYKFEGEIYSRIAKLSGEGGFDSYWERYFEHDLSKGAYRTAVALHSAQIRELTEAEQKKADSLATAINALRESYMKKCIMDALESGISPKQIVVVCGAYHVSGLADCAPMTDAEYAKMPQSESKLTLMPYSNYKLSSFSGYGAGNEAPFYYELMWRAINEGDVQGLPAQYLSRLSNEMRERHGYSSTATVIEAVRLAQSLAFMKGGRQPTLADLHDAAVATMAWGEKEAAAQSFAAVDIGTNIGVLPDGITQTPIQDDMNRQLKELRLEQYKSVVARTLVLDLRENRNVKSEKSAFLDLNRSTFFHRLTMLGIHFAQQASTRQDNATWSEGWNLCWTPESEIELVESVLFGDTIEKAAAFLLREKLKETEEVYELSQLVATAFNCCLPESMFDILLRLQAVSAESEDFSAIAKSARQISFLIRYKSLRRIDTKPLVPILEQLFLRGALLLNSAAGCDDAGARTVAADMTQLHLITQEHDEVVNDEIWLRQLKILQKSSDRNPILAGFACSILLERGKLSEEALGTELSRYLSAGSGTENGARWFEGLSLRNRYLLLSRVEIWQQLDEYLESLDDESFPSALVCLRRTFAAFEPSEKSGVCEILAELWNVDAGALSELLQGELGEKESAILDELANFDFGDLI